MLNDSKDIKGLSLKISFFASVFLLLFMMWITVFSFLYFFVSEINTMNTQIASSSELSPDTISDAIIMKVDSTNKVDADKLSLAIEENNEKIKDLFANWDVKVVPWEKGSSINSLKVNTEPVLKIANALTTDNKGVTISKISKNQPLFELARDSLIIDRSWSYTANWIFNFVSFNVEDLILRSPWFFTQFIGDKLYLFKKISGAEYEIIFTKDISYIMDFVFKMFIVGLISSFAFFLLVYILSTYLVRMFLKPINEYNKKLKEYNHNLAHEIKTPLTVVNMNLELLENDENKDIVQSNKEEIEKIKNITDSLLFLSENFSLKELQKIEINESITNYLKKSIFRDNIEVIPFKRPIEVMANKNMFDRLLKNLCENAMKYSSDKKLTIKVTEEEIFFTNKVDKQIKKEDLNMIFEAFYQVDSSRNVSWYWLGLTLVKRIVDIFKWNIDVSCENKEFQVKIKTEV